MKAASGSGDPPAVLEVNRSSSGSPLQGALRERARSLCSACRQVFGVPDYERYLTHAAQRHPGAPVLTRGDFFVQAIDRKYGKGGVRCC